MTDLAFFTGATGGSTSNCNAITDWSGSPLLDTVEFVQGSGALSAKVSKATYVSDFTLASPPVNMTGKQVFIWMASIAGGGLDTIANGGVRIRLIDSSARVAQWYVAGKDTWGGAWQAFMIHADSEPTSKDTGWDKTAIAAVGVTCITIRSSAYINFWWDALRYGTYIGIKGGTEVSPADLDYILTQEAVVDNKWGTCWRFEGLFLIQTKLKIGSPTAGEATYFKELSEVIIFPDRPVPVDFYDLTIQGNGTAETKVYFGITVGGRGVSGCTFRSAGTPKATFNATDSNITDLGLYGCSFFALSTISLPLYSATREVLSCTFEACAEVLPSTCTMTYCNFIAADNRGVRIASVSHHVTYCNFINCPHCVHINLSDSLELNNLQFSGSDGSSKYDIEHSVAGALTVNCVSSNPQYVDETGGGSTNIINSVYLTVYVEDEDGNPVENAAVYIEKTDHTELMRELTVLVQEDSTWVARAQETFNYPDSPVDINVRVRKSSLGSARFIPYRTTGTITSGGYTLKVVLVADLVAA